jgi:hypothetical protein
MRTARTIAAVIAVLAIGGFATGVAGGELPRHSGLVVAIDDETGAFVLAEVGPWRVRDGETVVTRQTIMVTDETKFVLARRVDRPPSGYPRDYVVHDLDLWGLDIGDFVTVECRHERGRLLATKVIVVDVPGD